MVPSNEALRGKIQYKEDMVPSNEALRGKIQYKEDMVQDLLPSNEALKCRARYSVKRTCYHKSAGWPTCGN